MHSMLNYVLHDSCRRKSTNHTQHSCKTHIHRYIQTLVLTATGHWGMCLPDFQLFNFSGHFRAAQTLIFDSMWLPTQNNILTYSFA